MFKIITIPFDRDTKTFDEDVFNKFILNKKIKSYQVNFFQDGEDSFWSVFLEYDPLIEKTAEKELDGLDKPQRILLDTLKAWRKQRAEKDGVPVFIIGTNKELVDIVKKAPKSIEGLKEIKGFGKAKTSKYGHEITEIIKGFYSKT
jgi:superfamily II DNA helicase RecQ